MGLYVLTGKCLSNLLSSLFSLFYIILPPSLLLHSLFFISNFFMRVSLFLPVACLFSYPLSTYFPFYQFFHFQIHFPSPPRVPLLSPFSFSSILYFIPTFLSSAFYLSTMVELNTKYWLMKKHHPISSPNLGRKT